MFASRVRKTVTLPSDQTVSVVICKLSWLQRQDARRQCQHASSRDLVSMGGAEFMRVIREMEQPTAAVPSAPAAEVPAAETAAPVDVETLAKAVAPKDPIELALATHDWLTVLVCGVKEWTAPDAVITKATLGDLDDEDAEFLVREILTLSLPSAQLETDRKNAE